MISDFKDICDFKRKLPPGKAFSVSDPEIFPIIDNLKNIRNFLEKEFKFYKGYDLNFEYSRGQGNFPKVLHVTILPPGQQVSKGVYVGICFDVEGRGALAGCVESAANPQGLLTVERRKRGSTLLIDVDGRRDETKYNNCFANPRDFYPHSIKTEELIEHLRLSLDLALFHLNLGNADSLNVESVIQSGKLEQPFDPASLTDAKERIAREIALRRGQKKFRNSLLKAYNFECAVTGSSLSEVLEAAHIMAYNGNDTNHVQNGLLLRSDIHTLFDLGLLTIDCETFKVLVHKRLAASEYQIFQDKKIQLPGSMEHWPNRTALREHNLIFFGK